MLANLNELCFITWWFPSVLKASKMATVMDSYNHATVIFVFDVLCSAWPLNLKRYNQFWALLRTVMSCVKPICSAREWRGRGERDFDDSWHQTSLKLVSFLQIPCLLLKPKRIYGNTGYSGMLDMNFCKMTRKPQHFVVDVSIGSIGARKEKGAALRWGNFGSEMQGGARAWAPTKKHHALSREGNTVQWDLSFGRVDMCNREKWGWDNASCVPNTVLGICTLPQFSLILIQHYEMLTMILPVLPIMKLKDKDRQPYEHKGFKA